MSDKQFKLIISLALGFLIGKVTLWLSFGLWLYLTGRI